RRARSGGPRLVLEEAVRLLLYSCVYCTMPSCFWCRVFGTVCVLLLKCCVCIAPSVGGIPGRAPSDPRLVCGVVYALQVARECCTSFLCERRCYFCPELFHPAPNALTSLGSIANAPRRLKVRRENVTCAAVVLVMLMQTALSEEPFRKGCMTLSKTTRSWAQCRRRSVHVRIQAGYSIFRCTRAHREAGAKCV
ncbi:unnamed protein product, partial [Ectocarpus sp. 12 AP-2014]